MQLLFQESYMLKSHENVTYKFQDQRRVLRLLYFVGHPVLLIINKKVLKEAKSKIHSSFKLKMDSTGASSVY